MSDSVRPHRRQPTRLPRPCDSPGKNTGVGCHFLLQCMEVKSEVAQSCPTLSMDCSLPGSSVHGIFQARVLEWGAIAFSGDNMVTLLFFFFKRSSFQIDILSRLVEIKKRQRIDQPSLETISWTQRHDASNYVYCAELDSVAILIVREIGKFSLSSGEPYAQLSILFL